MRDDALHTRPGAQGRRSRYVDDLSRLLHHEAERSVGSRCPSPGPEFGKLHPFVPQSSRPQAISTFSKSWHALCEITGFAAVSLQPNAGSQGEFAGLMVIRAHHHNRGDLNRDVVLIPASAHGTNPASAVMAGMRVVVVNSTSAKATSMSPISRPKPKLIAKIYRR